MKAHPPVSLSGVVPDLAIEAHEMLQGRHEGEITGVSLVKEHFSSGCLSTIKVLNEQGAQAMGKPIGTYITIEAPSILDSGRGGCQPVVDALIKALKEILPAGEQYTILVAGLGNARSIPDALGPMVTSRLVATRYLFTLNDPSITKGLRSLAVITPGVTGVTGVEAAEILEGLIALVRPDCLLCIDALAAGDLSRLHNTIQLSDTGIRPGSGIGNKRKSIDKETVGIPVLAIGVPTVVQAGVIANKALTVLTQRLEQKDGETAGPLLISQQQRDEVINEILQPFGGSLMVTPKEIDEQADHTAQIIAKAITLAVHPGLKAKDLEYFLH
jgi:spore protease